MITAIARIIGRVASFIGRFLPVDPPRVTFIFPFFHIGGAEKVHADIVGCFASEKPWIFFAKKSRDNSFRKAFEAGGWVFDVGPLLKYTYPLSTGILAGIVNRRRNAVVFGCNSLFFYKMLPLLAPHVRKVDLIHAFGGGAEDFSLPVAHFLDARVVITEKTREDFRAQYRANGIDDRLAERIVLIPNRVDVPSERPRKSGLPLRALYVGRGTEEKRVHLVGELAAACAEKGLPVRFRLVGPSPEAVPPEFRGFCEFTGEVCDRSEMDRCYDEAHLLLVASSREGFPMVIMEGMARGAVPVSTDVGGIGRHLRNGVNGFLVESHPEEGRIVREMCDIIARLCADGALLDRVSAAAYDYAAENFGGERFCAGYRDVLGAGGEGCA